MPKSDEEIPTVPHPKAQNPPSYVILTYFGYVSESHRTCRPLIQELEERTTESQQDRSMQELCLTSDLASLSASPKQLFLR